MFLYKLELSRDYYKLYGALFKGIVKSYVVSAPRPEIAQKLVNEHPGGGERNVSLGGFGLLGYADRTDIWLNKKYVTVSKIGTSDIDQGVILSSLE